MELILIFHPQNQCICLLSYSGFQFLAHFPLSLSALSQLHFVFLHPVIFRCSCCGVLPSKAEVLLPLASFRFHPIQQKECSKCLPGWFWCFLYCKGNANSDWIWILTSSGHFGFLDLHNPFAFILFLGPLTKIKLLVVDCQPSWFAVLCTIHPLKGIIALALSSSYLVLGEMLGLNLKFDHRPTIPCLRSSYFRQILTPDPAI